MSVASVRRLIITCNETVVGCGADSSVFSLLEVEEALLEAWLEVISRVGLVLDVILIRTPLESVVLFALFELVDEVDVGVIILEAMTVTFPTRGLGRCCERASMEM